MQINRLEINMNKDLTHFVTALKSTILQSQYNAAKAVNSAMVQLYFVLGGAISNKVKQANWGDKALENIALELQKELKGLKGFSHQNLKKMKLFYEAYPFMLPYCALYTNVINNQNTVLEIGSTLSNQFENTTSSDEVEISSTVSNQLQESFWKISFSNHYSIINSTKEFVIRAYYIQCSNENAWSNRILENHLKNKIHEQNTLRSNFENELVQVEASKGIAQFRDEYLLDFLNIEDADNERVIENKVVQNIKDFILHMGTGFSFIGNQYRLEVDNEEFFIDLLFFNRHLQALVAIELKRGKFKPEHLGQLSFYLNVLDDQVKLAHENPSIGIILCKEKNNAVVEYALRNKNQPLGVATFKTKQEIPDNMKNILPSIDDLKKIMNTND